MPKRGVQSMSRSALSIDRTAVPARDSPQCSSGGRWRRAISMGTSTTLASTPIARAIRCMTPTMLVISEPETL